MSKLAFLAYLPDPLEINGPLFVKCGATEDSKLTSIDELSAHDGPLVTFDTAALVEEFRRAKKPLPAVLINLDDALRLRSGRSRDQGGEREWNVWRALKPFFEDGADREAVYALIQSRIARPSENDARRLLEVTCRALRKLWESATKDLEAQGETKRFFDIEVPCHQIFLARQYQGIRIDAKNIEKYLDAVSIEKYKAFREVASVLGFSPVGLGFARIGEFLPKTDARHLTEFSEYSTLREYFRIIEHTSTFAHSFLQFINASHDHSVLTRACAPTDRLYPLFHTLGTVTGRIIVSQPKLQELRKKYRGIIAADEGKRLFYFDYAQFEPGILAALAGDTAFIERYNSTDLYLGLSSALFGDDTHRTLCKRIFLGFCYGMSRDNIAKLLAGPDATVEQLTKYKDLVKSFFDAFPKLDEYKKTLEVRLEAEGFVSTLFGNRRVRNSKGGLTHKERRWAVSQMIQGTASLVFKEALIGLAKRFGRDSILLPMHDAVLMQLPVSPGNNESEKIEAVGIMKEAFTKWCGAAQPKVVIQSFAEAS